MRLKLLLLGAVAALVAACSSGGEAAGTLQLVEFLESGKDNVARNTSLVFRFSAPIEPNQDLAARLSIKTVPGSSGQSPFVPAVGHYVVSGDVVTFVPRYPERADYSDAGLLPTSNYSVFLDSGTDALQSATGDRIGFQTERLFETSDHFDDPVPNEPPRVIRLVANDPVSGASTDLSRIDPRPDALAALDSAALLAGGRAIDPGAGGAPYRTKWHLDLIVSEPLDPATVNNEHVELFEIRHDALEGADTATPGHFGTEVEYRVPITVETVQRYSETGDLTVAVRVVPLWTLLDDARYRIVFKGAIMGVDNRKTFIGDNGLTGDGQTVVGGEVHEEPGGLGYISEFLVYDREGITLSRTVDYEPRVDGIEPENGDTTVNPALINRVPYDPPESPSSAVGIVPVFGDGRDGDLAVAGGNTLVLSTGDIANPAEGNPFAVDDVDPDDSYSNNGSPQAGKRTFEYMAPREFHLTNLTVSSSSTLVIRGVNPARIRVTGTVQVNGVIDARGEDGLDGGAGSSIRPGGTPGAGGFKGGDAKAGLRACSVYASTCTSFDTYLNACQQAKAGFPFSQKGEGPGRGNQGGEFYQYYYVPNALGPGTDHVSGTGGGGAGHATPGQRGDDKLNAGGVAGTPGPACDSRYHHRNSGVIGARSVGGAAYGDRLLERLIGGSGGGAGGSMHQVTWSASEGSGGSGGGGGGALEILARGAILIHGGVIDVSGGRGGKGALVTTYTFSNLQQATGAGGGGSGGSLSLVSGEKIDVTSGLLDARGGAGGEAANVGTTSPGGACNAGGQGAPGFIFLMDPDGEIDGLGVAGPGDYDNHANGTLTVRSFETDRFGPISATTQLFNVGVGNPAYLDLDPQDFEAHLEPGQRIEVFMSTARPDAENPAVPDLATESDPVLVATVTHSGVTPIVTPVPDAMRLLNPGGTPDRESYLRVHVVFDYEIDVEAASGPFATLDRVTIRLRFNE